MYVMGNHEPFFVEAYPADGPLPTPLNHGQVICFRDNINQLRVAGISGNYSTRILSPKSEYGACVTADSVDTLKLIPAGGLDILLVHESPLNYFSSRECSEIASCLVREIDRIGPGFVFSGHVGSYKENCTPKGVRVITLDDAARGYGVLTVDSTGLHFERKIAVHARLGKD